MIQDCIVETQLKGRYITNEHILPVIKQLTADFKLETIGKSVENRDIYSIRWGIGPKKVLLWSQMHGNESTTTKGLFDFIKFLGINSEESVEIYNTYTLLSIPILNPDGAAAYTRVNANKIDLNRDAFEITQPESKVLRSIIEQFNPHYCYNLHDQRTIFGTNDSFLPATVSFLAPAYNDSREYNETRYRAIEIINKMNDCLQMYIPSQVGRFDDSFNINCIGDYLTYKGIPTILFEAGHFQNDYSRDYVRNFIFLALKSSFFNASNCLSEEEELEIYLKIPENIKCFYDIIYKNVGFIDNSVKKTINFAAHYTERLHNNDIFYDAHVIQVEALGDLRGHFEYDGNNSVYKCKLRRFPEIGENISELVQNF